MRHVQTGVQNRLSESLQVFRDNVVPEVSTITGICPNAIVTIIVIYQWSVNFPNLQQFVRDLVQRSYHYQTQGSDWSSVHLGSGLMITIFGVCPPPNNRILTFQDWSSNFKFFFWVFYCCSFRPFVSGTRTIFKRTGSGIGT